MSVLRVKHDKNYVVLNKEILDNPEISLKAKGLWAFCMGKPDDWEFHFTQIEKTIKEGEKALRSALDELIQWGYCMKIQRKDSKGQWLPFDYEMREQSQLKKCLPHSCFRRADKRRAEKEVLLSNKEEPNIDLTKETHIPIAPSTQESEKAEDSAPMDDMALQKSFKKGKLNAAQIERAIKWYRANLNLLNEKDNPIGYTIFMIKGDKDIIEQQQNIASGNDIAHKRRKWAEMHERKLDKKGHYIVALSDRIEFWKSDLNDPKDYIGPEKIGDLLYSKKNAFWEHHGLI